MDGVYLHNASDMQELLSHLTSQAVISLNASPEHGSLSINNLVVIEKSSLDWLYLYNIC